MTIYEMTKKDFKELENFMPNEDFYSIIILPENKKHDSGFECMSFILEGKDGNVVGKVSGWSDVVHINGIGGYGDWKEFEGPPRRIKPIGWSIDCLPKSHLLRIFGRGKLKLDTFIGSSFQFFDNTEEVDDK